MTVQYQVHCPLCRQDFISTDKQGGGCPFCAAILGGPTTIICGSFTPIEREGDTEKDGTQ